MEELVRNEILPFFNLTEDSHSIDHFIKVRDHAIQAVKDIDLEQWQKDAIITAAFLHDVDDVKLTGKLDARKSSIKDDLCDVKLAKGISPLYHNTWCEYTLEKCNIPNGDIILKMIDLVSCSKWGDRKDETSPDWYYIPRYCDRLEGLDVERTISYSNGLGRPMYDENTERVYKKEDIPLVATQERYELYTRGIQKSKTAIGHFYDKLLHIRLPEWMKNEYLEDEFKKRSLYVENWLIEYWNQQ